MTLLSADPTIIDETAALAEQAVAPVPKERAGYYSCTACGCGGYVDNGTGDCRCGHSFGQHYSS